MWRVYHEAAEGANTIHPVAYSTFCYLWRTLVPSIVVMKPRSDLCWQCQHNSTIITRSANSSESETSAVLGDTLEHLQIVKMERSHKSVCEECKDSMQAHFVVDGTFSPPPLYSQTPVQLTSKYIILSIMHSKCIIHVTRSNLFPDTSQMHNFWR